MLFLHSFLCSNLFLCGFFVCFSKTPIESVLFLVLTFCNAAAISFILNVEFFGLVIIIVYVGAVAVLFLFVIMMLNIKNQKEQLYIENFGLNYIAFFYLLGLILFFFLRKIFYYQNLNLDEKTQDVFLILDKLYNVDIMGQVLFNYFLVCFLIAGFILLVALVGAIVLTLRYNNISEGQNVNKQLSRSVNFLSFFK